MYEKPRIERFGTFRELTRLGFDQGTDLFGAFGIPGCEAGSTADFARCDNRS